MNIVDFLNLLVAAVLLAGVYAAMSVGMTIIYGVLKIVNLAHAGFLMLGAYFVYELYTRFNVDPLLGVILAFPVFFFDRSWDLLAFGAPHPAIGSTYLALSSSSLRALARAPKFG